DDINTLPNNTIHPAMTFSLNIEACEIEGRPPLRKGIYWKGDVLNSCTIETQIINHWLLIITL
ncbi:hypothetical protein, partial [Shewanella sp.]|uniref:hypothetical protein n=1 Tax=Shewanella sp. TaxID=50422 RepID=UPI003F30D9EB